MSGDGEIFCSDRHLLFSYKFVNCVFDNVLVDDTLISLIILSSIWQLAAFPYMYAVTLLYSPTDEAPQFCCGAG